MNLDQQLQKIELEWWNMFQRCYTPTWCWGPLQPDYVYIPAPLVIIDDSHE